MAKEPDSLAEIHDAEISDAGTAVADATAPATPSNGQAGAANPAATPAEPPADPSDDDEASDSDIRTWIKENLDCDVSQYNTDEDAIKGLVEARRTLSRRDEDAEYGRQVRDLLKGREQEVIDMLRGEGNKKPPEPDKKGELPTWEELQLLSVRAADENAPPALREKYSQLQADVARKMFSLARDPESFLAPILEKVVRDVEARAQQAAASVVGQSEQAASMRSWESQNKQLIYANGQDASGGLSPIGQEVVKVDALLAEDGVTDPLRRLNRALEFAVNKHRGATPPPKKMPNKVGRQPAIATRDAQADKTEDELFAEEGANLLSVFLKQNPDLK